MKAILNSRDTKCLFCERGEGCKYNPARCKRFKYDETKPASELLNKAKKEAEEKMADLLKKEATEEKDVGYPTESEDATNE